MAEDKVKITCKCGKRIKVPAALRGKKVKCPNCGKPVLVKPEFKDEDTRAIPSYTPPSVLSGGDKTERDEPFKETTPAASATKSDIEELKKLFTQESADAADEESDDAGAETKAEKPKPPPPKRWMDPNRKRLSVADMLKGKTTDMVRWKYRGREVKAPTLIPFGVKLVIAAIGLGVVLIIGLLITKSATYDAEKDLRARTAEIESALSSGGDVDPSAADYIVGVIDSNPTGLPVDVRVAALAAAARAELARKGFDRDRIDLAIGWAGLAIGIAPSKEEQSKYYLLKAELILRKANRNKQCFSATAADDARRAAGLDPTNKRAYEFLFTMYEREYDRRGGDKARMAARIRTLYKGILTAKQGAVSDKERARFEEMTVAFSRYANY